MRKERHMSEFLDRLAGLADAQVPALAPVELVRRRGEQRRARARRLGGAAAALLVVAAGAAAYAVKGGDSDALQYAPQPSAHASVEPAPSGAPVAPPAEPTPAASESRLEPRVAPDQVVFFESPTENIVCFLAGHTASCEIGRYD